MKGAGAGSGRGVVVRHVSAMVLEHVWVISSVNFDTTLSLQHMPAAGETVLAHAKTTSLGGKGANTAMAAALSQRAQSVHLVAAVGKDFEPLLDKLGAQGVDASHVAVLDDCATGSAVVLLDSDSGENRIIVEPGANMRLSAAMCDRVTWARCAVVLHMEIPLDVVEHVAELAFRQKAIVVLNPSPLPPRDSHLCRADASLWRHVHVIIVNEVEAEQLSGVRVGRGADVRAAGAPVVAALRQRCLPDAYIVLTLGARGVVYSGRDADVHHEPAVPVAHVKNTTAAGDTFTGYLAAALSPDFLIRNCEFEQRRRDSEFQQCVRYAAAAAALCVSRPGTLNSIPDHAHVSQTLSRRPVRVVCHCPVCEPPRPRRAAPDAAAESVSTNVQSESAATFIG